MRAREIFQENVAQRVAPTEAMVAAFAESVKDTLGLQVFSIYLRDGDTIKLNVLRVAKGSQKQGSGTAAMERLCAFADQHGLRIILSPALPDREAGTTSRARLVAFYKRFGFYENKGRKKDFSISEGMIREPRS